MKIETKFDIGDNVWFLHDNKVREGMLMQMDIIIDTNTSISDMPTRKRMNCKVKLTEGYYIYNEDILFSTKQELLDSL